MITTRSRLAIEIAVVGLAAGIAGDALLRATPWGLNVAIYTALLVGAGVWLVRRHRISPGPDAAWLAITALLLGAAFLRRDAESLAAFDMLALLVVLAISAASVQGESISTWYPIDYVRGIVSSGIASAAGSFLLIGQDIPWNELPQDARMRKIRAVLLGGLIAAPLLVVFAALFASADQVFNNVLTNVISVDFESIFQHTFVICFLGALAAGYLRWGLLGRPFAGLKPRTAAPESILPLATALGLLNALFLLFVVVQLRYFFGGAALVEQTGGLTYAEYARQGFFQLVVATGLVLPVLLVADRVVRHGSPAQLRVFRQLAGLLLLFLVVIMASALERMRLYVAAFGLSTDRLYATAFMFLLAGVFAWFAWTVLRGSRQRFAFGAMMQALAVLAGLHVLNPEAFVVKTNLNRPAAERPFDAKYALTLGADAVPLLIEALPRLPQADRCVAAAKLLQRWDRETSDWRTWNWSRSRARRLVHENEAALRELACKIPSRS